jgi:hypothetical protein
VIRGELSSGRTCLQTSHPMGQFYPDHCPAFGTGELRRNDATL